MHIFSIAHVSVSAWINSCEGDDVCVCVGVCVCTGGMSEGVAKKVWTCSNTSIISS